MTSITFFPPFPDRLTLTTHLYRAVWAFLPCIDHIDHIALPYDGADQALIDADQLCAFAQAFLPKDFDPAIARLAPTWSGKIGFELPPNPTALVVWDLRDEDTVLEAEQLAKALGAQVVKSDPTASERDLIDLILLAFEFEPEHVALRRTGDHFARFTHLVRDLSGKPAHLFGTGPSVQTLIDKAPSFDGIAMVCNALIGNDAALAALAPKLLVAGDPVQHNGPSRTAGEFRCNLAAALTADSDRQAIVPMGLVPYLEATLPPSLAERVIGIPTAAIPGFNLDLAKQFATATTANIMTMLMLPVAFTFSRRVTLYGCDGKAEDSDIAPWRHTSEVAYQSSMDSCKRMHPSFWAKDFRSEYDAYCQDLSSLLMLAEQAGASVRSGTPSFIPALQSRAVTSSV